MSENRMFPTNNINSALIANQIGIWHSTAQQQAPMKLQNEHMGHKPHSTSQSKLQSSSNYPSRLRIHSHQQTPKREHNQLPSSKFLNLQKLRNNSIQFKQSNGIMNQPPNYISSKYTFKNDFQTSRITQKSTCVFDSCCSIIKESQRQVYLSPTQLISMGYFYNSSKEPKSLKIQKNGKSTNSMQKSFFKQTSNLIE